MRILLDTHVFLWAIAGETSRISPKALRAILNPDNERLVSTVSLWEIAVKVRAGKLRVPCEISYFETHRERLAASWLSITPTHVLRVATLPSHHRDPFDHLLISQSLCEGIPLVTSDKTIRKYGLRTVW
jgi:PIN domain nuclease of toxin-antitoxin system